MQRTLPTKRTRPELPTRQKPRSYLVRQFVPESDEHVETADDAPADALLVVTNDIPKLEAKRKAAESKARAELEAAKARKVALDGEIANASDVEKKARMRHELDMQEAELAYLAKEIEVRSRPSTARVLLMFRLREGELSDDARLEGALLVPGEGEPIPLRFEGGRSGRGVTMSAEVPLNTTVYVALHLVGLAGVAVEVLLLGGGTIMSVHA